MMIGAVVITIGQKNKPPLTVHILHQVAMARALNDAVLSGTRAMGENGILGIGLIGAIDIAAARYGDAVGQFGAALGDEQIIVGAFFINMGASG